MYTKADWPIQKYAFWVKNGFKPGNVKKVNGRTVFTPVYEQADQADVEIAELDLKLITEQLADLTAALDVGLYDNVELHKLYKHARELQRQADALVQSFVEVA